MKTLYLDCGMGAAGDMLTAALLELFPDRDAILKKLNGLGIPDVVYTAEPAVKCGILGTRMHVAVHGEEEGESAEAPRHETHGKEHEHGHHHGRGMQEIETIIRSLALPDAVRKDILAVYSLIAEAESSVHGRPVELIHFHEVGAMDAVADISAVCLLMHLLAPDEVIVSPVHVGSGQVRCAHGILPVPAPATAFILKDCPIWSGQVRGELCTPTGAALLKHFASRFGSMPIMRTQAIGYGMGKKDFEQANCVRAFLGTSEGSRDTVSELSFNVDDMTAEAIAYLTGKLLEAGAKDVYTIPIGMKKSRPGILVRVMCTAEDRERLLSLIFRHSSTIGVRENICGRYILDRREETVMTDLGPVRRKISSGYGVKRCKYEYEDIKRIASENDLSLNEVLARLPDASPKEGI